MLKKILSHSIIYGIAPQIPRIIGVFTLPIITKYLTKIDYGVFGIVMAISVALGAFSTLGLNVTIANYFFKSPYQYKWAWRQIYGFLLLWSIPYTIIIALLLYLFIPDVARDNQWTIILYATLPIVLFGPTSMLGSLYFQYNDRPLQVGIRAAVMGVLGVSLNLLFVAYYKMGYMGLFLASFIVNILMQASYWYPINVVLKFSPIFNFKRRFIKDKLKIGLPTIPHYYGGYLMDSSDKLIMKFLNISTANIGLYNMGVTFGSISSQAASAITVAIGPKITELYKEKKELKARNLVFSMQIVFLVGAFLGSIWLKEIMDILISNDELKTVYPFALILVMGFTYRPMFVASVNKIYFIEKTKNLYKISLIAGIGNVILNLIFIPIFGFEVAAYTTFVGLMFLGYRGFYLKDFRENTPVNYHPEKWLLLTVLVTILAYFFVEFQRPYKIVISLISLVAFLFIMKKRQKRLRIM